MKILIVAPKAVDNFEYYNVNEAATYNYTLPMGLLYISSALKSRFSGVDFLNLNHLHGTMDLLIAQATADKEYDLIMTGGISSEFHSVKAVVDASRKHSPDSKVVLGGGLITSEPELMIRELGADYIVIGEGEVTVVQLVDALEQGHDLDQVDGIGFVCDDRYVQTNERMAIMDLDSLAFPDFDGIGFQEYLDHSTYIHYEVFPEPIQRSYPLVSSRSCPFKCTFCFHPLGSKYRQRSMSNLRIELEENIVRYGINVVNIYDELLGYKKERVYEICEMFNDLRRKVGHTIYWSCQLRVNFIEDDMLASMSASGCYAISYGFESYSSQVLKSMKKGIKPEEIDRAVELTRKNRITVQGNLIFGDPEENAESIKESLDFYKNNYRLHLGLGFIQPYPGTALYAYCLENGLIKDRMQFIKYKMRTRINMSRHLSDVEFDLLFVDIDMILWKYCSFSYPLNIEPEGQMFNITVACPECGEVIKYKKRHVSSVNRIKQTVHCNYCRARFKILSRMQRVLDLTAYYVLSSMPAHIRLGFFNIFKYFKYNIFKVLPK